MYYNLIRNYISKLSIDDIKSFSEKENILVTDHELNIIYKTIKYEWESLYNGDENVFNDLKRELSTRVYNKIVALYDEYKKKLL